MLKMTIDDEEVVSKNNFTIKEEMLSASSTILNNTYPKTWEQDHDYISRFYYPKDYAKLNIKKFSLEQEAEAGTTIEVNGSATLTDVDTTKESRVISLKGQTSQTGTPTPTSPIPVNVVSGDNSIEVMGKNLLDIQTNINANTGSGLTLTYNSDGSVSMVGTTTRTYGYITSYYDNYLPVGTYTLSINQALTHRLYMNITYEDDTTSNITINAGSTKGTLTTTKAIKKTQIAVSNMTNNTAYNETISIMLEVGNQATTYEPYTGNSYPLYLGVENLFDKDSATLGYRLGSDGAPYSDSNYILSDFIKVEPSSTLTYSRYRGGAGSACVCYYDTNKTFISRTTWGSYTANSYLTFTTTNTTVYVRITDSKNLADQMQLEKGSKSNSYSAYGTTPIELCKIGNYQDSIYKGVGYNLFDGETELGSYDNTTGLPIASTAVRRNVNYVSVVPNNTYTFSRGGTALSVRLYYYKADNTFISAETKSSGQFTTPSECYKVNFISDQIVSNYASLTINEGTTALPYEPYNAKDKWLLHKEIGKYKAEDATWNYFSIAQGSLFRTDSLNIIYNSTCYSNYYTCLTQATRANPCTYINDANPYIDVIDSRFTSASAFKTWAINNNVVWYVPLNTPTTTEITDTTLLEQLDNLESE